MTDLETKWAARVRAWRASGQSAQAFSEGQPFKASTLRCWSSKLPKSTTAPEIARVQVVRSRAERQGPGEVVVEMGNARVRVSEGVDMALVRQVLALVTEVA